MGAPLSPLWPGGPRGARTGEWGGRGGGGGGSEGRRGGGGGGSLASSLICKKCITSEIKRKITAPKQNTQSRREEEKGRWVGREGGVCVGGGCGYACVNRKEVGKREGGFTCIDALLDSKKEDGYLYKYI